MSNPNNLVRPAVLNAPQNQGVNMAELQQEIRRIITETLQEQARISAAQINQDQVIDPQHRGTLSDLDKIPDVVRCLRDFSGQPGEYSSWRKSVDRILGIYQHLKGTPKYFGILKTIRNKVIGNADAILESYNTPLNWDSISRCLTMHYADKRDVSTLEYQMTSLIQGAETIQDFYQRVYNHLSLILNKISSMDVGHESMCLLTQTYRDKALDTFVRGLKGDLPRLLAIKEPTDLPNALHLCLKLENQNFRTNYAHNLRSNRNFSTIPSRNQSTIYSSRHQLPSYSSRNQSALRNQNNFHPELAYIPSPPRPNRIPDTIQGRDMFNQGQRNYQHQGAIPKYNQYQNYIPPRPFAPKPPPRPEPMDVDQSIRTKNINYMNRPSNNGFLGKRPPPLQNTEARKQSRNFHLRAEIDHTTEKQDTDEIYQEPTEDISHEQTLHDYDYDNVDEIHFLD